MRNRVGIHFHLREHFQMQCLATLVASAAAAVALAQTPSPATAAAPTPAYRNVRTIPLGAPDRWDYLSFDPESHRIYVSHGDRVTVVDGHDGTVFGEVTGFPGGTHGIAVATAMGRGYTDNGRAGEAASFDLATLKVGKRIKAAEDADGIAFDPVRRRIFSSNGQDRTLSIIGELDAQTFVPLGEIRTAPLARTMSIDPATGRIYVVTADLDEKAPADPPAGAGLRRRQIVPGSVKLLFLDPVAP